ncbi:MAG: helix-turn-helix domain-containing protein [Halioglobus sp.]
MAVDIERHDAVKRQLRAKGIRLTDIASEVGCTASLVTMVSQGHRSHDAIEDAICRNLDEPRTDLWPSRFCKEVNN